MTSNGNSAHSNQEIDYDVVILGAGVAGLSAADRLTRAGLRVAIIEHSDRCGGAHNSTNIGPYTFDHGSIFYEEDARIFGLADGLRDQCPVVKRQQRRIAPTGQVLHYPIEPRDMFRAPPSRILSSGIDLLLSRVLVRRDGTLAAIIRKRLGKRFFEDTGLHHYIRRFNRTPTRQIDEKFFFHRMGFIERFTRFSTMISAVFRSLTTHKRFNSGKRKGLRIRPQAGFDALFNHIRKSIEGSGGQFYLGETVTHLQKTGAVYELRTDNARWTAASVISTIPLDALHRAMFGEPSGLQAIDMTTLFVSAATLDEGTGNVLFNFHQHGEWKRATIYSRLYPDAAISREFMAVEVTLPGGAAPNPQDAFVDFEKHLLDLGLASDLRLEGSTFQPSCYPLYTLDSDAVRARVLQRVAALGIITAGRQGRFEYLPTSTGVIRRVSEELDFADLERAIRTVDAGKRATANANVTQPHRV